MAVAVAALLALAVPASADSTSAACAWQFAGPTLLYQTPTADVLPTGALAFSAAPTIPLTNTSMNVDYPEVDASIRFSPYRHLDFAVTAYTFADYVLDVKYQVLGGGLDRVGLAVGAYDIGLSSYVSPIGHDTTNAWPDWKDTGRTAELFSAFAVASFPVTQFFRLHVGLGRGRFIGYSGLNSYLNTDVFLDKPHEWALGLFGGAEVFLTPMVAVVAEVGGRDLNSGVRFNFDPLTATIAWTKMEGVFIAQGGPNGTPKFGRLEFGLNYQFNNLARRSEVARSPAYFVPSFGPSPQRPNPESLLAASIPSRLLPIYFELDKSEIRAEYTEVLKRDAAAILARAKTGQKADVVIEGHCCPLASETFNVDLGMQRAEAARAYLVWLGVNPALLTVRSSDEANPPHQEEVDYYLDRRDEFKWKY